MQNLEGICSQHQHQNSTELKDCLQHSNNELTFQLGTMNSIKNSIDNNFAINSNIYKEINKWVDDSFFICRDFSYFNMFFFHPAFSLKMGLQHFAKLSNDEHQRLNSNLKLMFDENVIQSKQEIQKHFAVMQDFLAK